MTIPENEPPAGVHKNEGWKQAFLQKPELLSPAQEPVLRVLERICISLTM
jgi:hypothetical protein